MRADAGEGGGESTTGAGDEAGEEELSWRESFPGVSTLEVLQEVGVTGWAEGAGRPEGSLACRHVFSGLGLGLGLGLGSKEA